MRRVVKPFYRKRLRFFAQGSDLRNRRKYLRFRFFTAPPELYFPELYFVETFISLNVIRNKILEPETPIPRTDIRLFAILRYIPKIIGREIYDESEADNRKPQDR